MSKFGIEGRGTAYKEKFISDTTNIAGGSAFSVKDPSQRLLHIVGSPGFNEPSSYYAIPENPDLARKFKGSLKGLTGQAKEIIDAAIDVARSDNPRDLSSIAHWLRVEGYCRQTPQVLLAIAASEAGTRRYVREYGPKIIRRADELMGAYAAYRYIFGKPIPSALLKGIRDAFGNFDEYQLIKYNQSGKTPSMKDVLLQMPDRRAGRPVSRGAAEFIINGNIVDKNGRDHSDTAPIIAAYLLFLEEARKSKELTPDILELADAGRVTWETILSLFGNKKEVWDSVLPRMGYMAVLRNLRNMAQAGVDCGNLASIIADELRVVKSKQYPFRFLSASNEIGSAVGINLGDKKILRDAISYALDISVANVGRVNGSSIVLVDGSGSMGAKPSARSSLTMAQIAACMAGILAKACDAAFVYSFATDFELIDVRSNDSVEAIIRKVMAADVGYATYPYKAIQHAVNEGLYSDRIVILSDMQCYHDRAGNLQQYIQGFKSNINRDVWVHSINLNAHDSSSQVSSDQKNVNLLSGFSDKILATMMEAENGEGQIPTLDYIRNKF